MIFRPIKSLCLFALFLNTVQSWTNKAVEETILNELNRTKIRESLQFLTKDPHVGGSIYNNRLADHIADLWTGFGFDSVEKVVYEVLLSFPDRLNPNKVELLDETDNVLFTSKHKESSARPEDEHPDFIPIFNTFSPKGTVEGDLIYANYASTEDFQTLTNLGLNLTGKIVIARYGKIFRGNKVNLASKYGAIGIILFNDPYEYAQDGEEADKVYPFTSWLPKSGAQRGSIAIGFPGDSQTPNYPSLHNVYRWPIEDIPLPKIPCQPIGYEDAQELMRCLGGLTLPEQWNDNSVNNFHIGPGFAENCQSKRKVRLTVNNELKLTNITNVIGIIRGEIEPDRFVIAGNHRDAWGFGAVDASSGTAQMIEVTRVFHQLLNQNWRPRRSLVFCSWDAEEFSITGSYEWVQDKLLKLSSTAVAYVNTDACVSGNLFLPNASPFLSQLLIDVTKEIPSPKNESQSLYQNWFEDSARHGEINSEGKIKVKNLGGGTDHVPFFAYAGIPSIDLSFQIDELDYARPFSMYAAYHTNFDTFYLVDTLIDPEYLRMASCGYLNLFLMHRLAQSDLLPFNMTAYRNTIVEAVQALHQDGIWNLLLQQNFNLDHLNASIHTFIQATKTWERRIEQLNHTDALTLRSLNDQLMLVDKSFLKSEGVPLQPQYRHLVFALSLHNMYGSSTFPGIRDLVHEISTHPNDDNAGRWLKLHRHISDIMIAFHTATDVLLPTYII